MKLSIKPTETGTTSSTTNLPEPVSILYKKQPQTREEFRTEYWPASDWLNARTSFSEGVLAGGEVERGVQTSALGSALAD
jgi:hypothetical protein